MSLHSPTSVNGEALSPSPSTNGPLTAVIDDLNRPPRLPRWTRQEILVLIQGKRVVESRVRRVGRAANPSSDGSAPSATVEPKWASVAAYCRRHGVNRGPVQCRKRWSNLAVDFKKIKEWESKAADGSDSFWIMRSDVRRQKKLPGFFDREVYEILDGGDAAEKAKIEEEVDDDRGPDGGGGEDGLGGEFEQPGREGAAREELGDGGVAAPVPISGNWCDLFSEGFEFRRLGFDFAGRYLNCGVFWFDARKWFSQNFERKRKRFLQSLNDDFKLQSFPILHGIYI